MTQVKSPFLIVPEFVSPMLAEEIVDTLDLFIPDTNKEGKPIPAIRFNDDCEAAIYESFLPIKDDIGVYFNVHHELTSQTQFEWYPAGSRGNLVCDNSAYLKKKWVRVKDRDLTAVVFLSDYNEHADFDDEYEVYGGKYEFPQHGFGFNAQRGTLVVYPSVPHFINTITPIQAGNLFIARFHIKTTVPFLYNPTDFPGDYRTWFREVV